MPERIFWSGRRCPITPVDITRVLGPRSEASLGLKREVVVAAICWASSRPPVPVTALAQPELTMMPRSLEPPRFSRTERETWTGAAWNLLVVKTAAPLHGRSEVIKAMSGFDVFDALTPTCVPETRKPLGYVPVEGTYLAFDVGIEDSTGAE